MWMSGVCVFQTVHICLHMWPVSQSVHVGFLFFFCIFFLFIISTGPRVHTLDCTCCCWILKPAPGTERHVWLTSSVLCKSLSGEQWSQAFQMDLGAGWLMHHSWPGFSQSLPSKPALISAQTRSTETYVIPLALKMCSPVARVKCRQFTFLQTVETFKF